jgi:cytochrome c biogenesis protein CcdA
VIYRDVMDGLFTPLTEWNVFLMIAFLVGFGIVFVIAACLIDKVRSLLFKLVRIDKLAGFIADVTVRITNIIGNAK